MSGTTWPKWPRCCWSLLSGMLLPLKCKTRILDESSTFSKDMIFRIIPSPISFQPYPAKKIVARCLSSSRWVWKIECLFWQKAVLKIDEPTTKILRSTNNKINWTRMIYTHIIYSYSRTSMLVNVQLWHIANTFEVLKWKKNTQGKMTITK